MGKIEDHEADENISTLQTFWLFQTYLHDLSSNPQSLSFQTCRRIYNKLQHIVFGLPGSGRHEKIKENVLPVTVLSSFVLASVALPMIPQWAGPLAVAQARKPQPEIESVPEAQSDTAESAPARAKSVTTSSSKSRRTKEGRNSSAPNVAKSGESRRRPTRSDSATSDASPSKSKPQVPTITTTSTRPSAFELSSLEARLSTSSLPLPSNHGSPRPQTPVSAGSGRTQEGSLSRRHSHHIKAPISPHDLTTDEKMRLLRQNYFRSQTQFLTALEGISNRLVIVPKPARMSALRAELALISQDLPAEVDIPVICPPTLVNGSPGKSRHHRIVRLNPAESTVLNSAEKVPYLMMVEVLREDFTFDPDTPDNIRLLTTLLDGKNSSRRIFDLSSDSPKAAQVEEPMEPIIDSVFEPVSGDLGSSPLLKPFDDEPAAPRPVKGQPYKPSRIASGSIPTSVDAATLQTSGSSTPRSPSPGHARKMTLTQPPRKATGADQPDFSALATHMRTASQMLAQLEATSGKRPKQEVAAIRAKIIASMQSLEEQSFDTEDHSPTFDTIIAKTSVANTVSDNPDLVEDDTQIDGKINASAGRERMENDFKTGGVQRKTDRDDPSAAVFGEAWEAKKERVRKSSPYGWMKNWDLVSVIVKTGADLRQEAFACQLINVCHKIWVDAGTNVWVKLMRILVTGESSGLIETITSGVSLHSLKRSLTLASIDSGTNPRHRIATLRDHFLKAFGQPDSEPFRAGVDAFKRSLAAYSIISYVLQLKDRHNGNVLIDSEGHIIHIDFGFMLSNSPGSVGFEAAPFKLTHEYVDVLGGIGSPDYDDYKKLCKQAFQGRSMAVFQPNNIPVADSAMQLCVDLRTIS